ncbi:YheC/YheD family protein [Natranaerobius trueperi]|uniref:ATP-grasp domain-containing protein n=1 Tax=Natranaerobius trueperi TaxID=759412 RepID=A0A226BXB4_9FIRM|nr:YheC/YheD family protein [Natranaerobius trueperi]OWZ82780.1 hypothetical protein CDO51_12245 [Natranaerobius trueperi]
MDNKSIKVVINTIQKNTSNISVPSSIFNKLNSSLYVDLNVGTFKTKATCYKNNTEKDLVISKYIADKVGIIDKLETNLLIKNNQIYLGPVIGVFISSGRVRKAKKQHPHFRQLKMSKANRDVNSILYFFSIKDIDFSQQKIHGTYYSNKNHTFQVKEFPYPDVLYDRGGATLTSQQRKSQKIREEIDKIAKPLKINSKYFFDKWNVYNNLLSFKEMTPYLRKSILYKSPHDLLSMLNNFSGVYLKDILGHNSLGVANIRAEGNTFILKYRSKRLLIKSFNSFDNLIEEINNFFYGKEVMIQAGIDVLKVNGCNVDMRAEVQKNGQGNLEVGPYMVRIGRKNSHVTSTSSGAIVNQFDNFFRNELNFSVDYINNLKNRIEKFLIITFNSIEKLYGPFGEIGIDFALDKNLKIWFIECNAKPGKDTIYLACTDDKIQRSFANPLNYGKFLWENRGN